MIQNREDYRRYLEADGAYLRNDFRYLFLNDIRRFKIVLRKAEYYRNCGRGIYGKLMAYFYEYRLISLGTKLGFTIPINVFGPGLSIPHHGTIVVNGNARIGANCRIHVCVNIGASGGTQHAPKIGNNVYIGPGAKIFGDIEIADGIAIGANAVVNTSFLDKDIIIAGIPAKKVGDGGAKKLAWPPQQEDAK